MSNMLLTLLTIFLLAFAGCKQEGKTALASTPVAVITPAVVISDFPTPAPFEFRRGEYNQGPAQKLKEVTGEEGKTSSPRPRSSAPKKTGGSKKEGNSFEMPFVQGFLDWFGFTGTVLKCLLNPLILIPLLLLLVFQVALGLPGTIARMILGRLRRSGGGDQEGVPRPRRR